MNPQHLCTLIHRGSALFVALAIALTGTHHALAEGECEPMQCGAAPDWGDHSWTIVDDATRTTGDQGRIAVIIGEEIYEVQDVADAIDQFAADLSAEGHPVVLATFRGEPDDLRGDLRDLYDEPASLSGAVLVDFLPYLRFEWGSGDDHESFPTDTYYMDLDGAWHDADTNGFHDTWDESQAEIWVSRIKVDNLPLLLDISPGGTDLEKRAYIISAYFERNHQHRVPTLPATPDWPFHPSEATLIYDDMSGSPGPAADHIRMAFESVRFVGESEVDEEEYLEPGGELSASPRNYLVHVHAHGGPTGHFLGPGGVSSQEYRDAYPNVIAFFLQSCHTCKFSHTDYLGGTIAFNPGSDTLVVVGHSNVEYGQSWKHLFRTIAASQSIGEGYKAVVSLAGTGSLGTVLLGDGSLSPPATLWTGAASGGDGERWYDDFNWTNPQDGHVRPEDHDYVEIVADWSDPEIFVDLGTPANPEEIWGLRITAPAMPGEVRLTIEEGNALGPRGSFVAETDASCSVLMERDTKLDISRVDLTNVDVTMTYDASQPPDLVVAGVIADSTISANNGNVTAGRIESSTLTVGADGSVSVEQAIFNSAFTVGEDATVTAGSITAGTSASQDWTLTQAKLEVDTGCYLGGDWTISGVASGETYSAEIGSLFANLGPGLAFGLQSTAKVDFDANVIFPGSSGEFNPEHELVYGSGENELGGGVQEIPLNGDPSVMYFGSHTRIRPLDEQEGNTLSLDLRTELQIASVFEHTFVCERWDTRAVDITIQPIWSEDEEEEQAIELISPEFGESFQGDPLAFVDVPCHGAFQDLILAAWEPDSVHPPDDPPLPVVMRDYYDNAASGWEPEATAFFRNVTIGANRDLKFYSTHGLIYYWGTLDMEDGANVYVDDVAYDVCGPACRAVVDTIYGDWTGDCEITNGELADLRSAIGGGSETYDPLMDYDCNGVLTNLIELPAFLDNMRTQPSCEPRGGDGGGGAGAGAESWTESYEGYDDVPGLAAWLIEVLSEEQLEALVADLTAAAAEFADSPVGQDLAELLCWLQ